MFTMQAPMTSLAIPCESVMMVGHIEDIGLLPGLSIVIVMILIIFIIIIIMMMKTLKRRLNTWENC